MEVRDLLEILDAVDDNKTVYVEVEIETKICLVEIKRVSIGYSPNVRASSYIILELGEELRK